MLDSGGFDVLDTSEAEDYRTTVSDYYRRCQTNNDFLRLGRLVETLKSASRAERSFFGIEGSELDDLVLKLPEVLYMCQSPASRPAD